MRRNPPSLLPPGCKPGASFLRFLKDMLWQRGEGQGKHLTETPNSNPFDSPFIAFRAAAHQDKSPSSN